MNKSNIRNNKLRDCRNNASSTGSNKAETCFPGTKIPKKFYITIALDMEGLLKAGLFKWREIVKAHFEGIMIGALEQLKDYRLRHRIWKFYGCDPGAGFKIEYDFGLIDVGGVIQLLRMDMLPISRRSIDALIDYIDGKLEEVDGVLKPVKE